MDFVTIIEEVRPWKNTEKTFKVRVSDPDEFEGLMAELHPQNPRHMVDTISKIQPLLTWTSCQYFARLLMAFQYDSKYFMIFEAFEEAVREFPLEDWQGILLETENGLRAVHNKLSFHGDICEETVKITNDGIKIVGWKLPKMRSFDPEPEVDHFEEDIKSLRLTVSRISGFAVEALLSTRYLAQDSQGAQAARPFDPSALPGNSIFFVSGKHLKCFFNGSEATVSQTATPKGSNLSFYKNKLYRSGGDLNDFSFQQYSFELRDWSPSQDLLSPHKYHTCIEFDGELWILAGIRSKKVERFDGEKWSPAAELPECLDNPTCAKADSLYLFSRGIFKLGPDGWAKLWSLEWVGCQGLCLGNEKFLVFGGRTTLGYNEDTYVVDCRKGAASVYDRGVAGLYGLFNYYVEKREVVIANNGGKVKVFEFAVLE